MHWQNWIVKYSTRADGRGPGSPTSKEAVMSAVLQATVGAGVELTRSIPGQDALLTPETLDFLAGLHRRFEPQRQARLAARARRQASFDAGALPDFRQDTAALRAADWRVAPLPASLLDRRVEITGPVDPKMVINALNSGAQVYMADFEDSTVADLGRTCSPASAPCATPSPARSTFDTGGQAVPPEAGRRAGGADGAAARLAPVRETRARRRRADQRQPVRPRPVRLPQRAARSRRRTAARTSTCPSCSRWKKRRSGTTCSRTSSRRSACPPGR